ncbi:uncharacterized protein LOC123880275 [Maniola jurtina]|uniref:uncharacterized protein LOC123880275 n=1 Tax=Maniola jurtina TaxID=191418 RepID=UPI001E68FB72|nr:uncharacterized protein LOC123880275 [Maniola jurtina]
MYRWLVVWQALLYVASGTLDLRLLNPRYPSASQFECYDYPPAMPLRSYDTGWPMHKNFGKILDITTPRYWPSSTKGFNDISRRIDLLWNRDEIIKEHAKLVQDINSLKQVMYVAPVAEERDYDDSVFPELIETFSTTTARPATRSARPTKSGFPVIVLGGGSRRHSTRNQPPKIPRRTISLVGTSSPVVRHPYPFVMAAASNQPVRICMPSSLTYPTTTRPPSLWERIVRAIIPR